MKNVVSGFPRPGCAKSLTPPARSIKSTIAPGTGAYTADASANALTINCYHQIKLFAKSMLCEYLTLGEGIFLHTEPPETCYFVMICRK